MGEVISLKEFSEKMGVSHLEVMKKLLENKIMVGINSSLDFDTVTLIATDFGVDVKKEQKQLNVESFMAGDLQAILDIDKTAEKTEPRAPIVTVMGHVDHGKTSLLDYLRKTNIAGGEAGGITQSIGASVVHHAGRDITFIDTPGHALFTALRARGSKITNVAIIVVAADDGLMPQTRESIEHAKAAGVPIIIAVTKIDKAQANMEKIKSDIGAFGLIPEDWGGDVPVLGVSSVTGQGIPELLDAVLLQAEMLDLRFDPRRSAVWVVLDAHKDQKQGVISSIILLTGTLKMTDIIVAYNTYGKVKRMQNWRGQSIKEAKGGDPIQILGLSELPEAGRIVEIVKNEREAQQKVLDIQAQDTENKKTTLETFLMELKTWDTAELKLVLRSEGGSSLEALKQAIDAIQLPKNVWVKVISADVGQFTEWDLSLAQASKALLLGFDVPVPSIFKKRAEQHQVEVKSFDIIYELTDFLTLLLQGMIKKEYEEVLTGKLNVLGVFFRKGKEMILWGKCIEWFIKNGAKLKIFRKIDWSNEEEEIANGEITSLQRDKNNVKEVAQWHECGMKVRVQKKIELGDILYFYDMQEKKETKESKEEVKEVKEVKEEAK